jgi:2-aminoadipate transaminase
MNPDSYAGFRFAARTAGLRPSAIREILKVTGRPDVISFAGGLPAPDLFPVESIRRAADAVLRDDGQAALQYDVTEGHAPLRAWVGEHLQRTVGLTARPEQVLITHGSQQALDLVAKVLLDPGDIVLVENPAYLGALQAFRVYEADIRGLPTDAEGLQIGALRDMLETGGRRPKLLYLVTNFQNPTGTSTSPERRRQIAALAAEFALPVLEDDPYGRLRYSGAASPALAALPTARHCLYLGTSSKILCPGLRVAWLVVPDPELYERLVVAKQGADLHTSAFTQRLVWEYVREPGRLDAHIATLISVYRRRRDAMLAALERWLPAGCDWTRPDGGLFLWVRLPESVDATALLQTCVAAKVAFVPGAPFWVGPPARHTLRLNFSHATEERIAEGIARFARALAA